MEEDTLVFTPFNPDTDDPLTLVEAIVQDGANLTIVEDSISYTGGFITEDEVFFGNSGDAPQTSFYDGSLDLNIGPGILLTSGDATPPLENTESGYSITQNGNTDSDLQAVADSAFEGSGEVQDANLLAFSFTINDPTVTSVTFDLVFGSDEFPEFSDSPFVDIAAVFVNGENAALFNNNENQPLSVISENLSLGNFIDNESNDLPIEYDGVSSALTIFAPVNQGTNTVKIGVGDTGDTALDSGLFVANFNTSSIGDGGSDGGGSGVLVEIPGTAGVDNIVGTENNEFIETFEGDDTVDPGAGNDIIDLGAGDDTLIGGNGNNNADGGEGNDTAVYSGTFADNNVEVVDENTVRVGDNTDTLDNFEFLEFDDQTVEIETLQEPEPEPEPTPEPEPAPEEGIEEFATADDELLEGSTGDDILEAIGFSGNTLEGLAGNDELIAGTNGILNGGDDDDVLEATPSGGGNVLNGDAGDDDLFGGNVVDNPDTLNGGDGDDRLFAGLAGNTLNGGSGSDQFWLAQAELPEATSLITDFTPGTDILGIAGLDTLVDSVEDLTFEPSDSNTTISIVANEETTPLAVLADFTGELTADDFTFGGATPEPPQPPEPPEIPTVEFSVEPSEGSETEATVFTLTATASEAVTGEQTVDLTLSGDANGDDFAENLPTAITIADGETTGFVEVTVADDDLAEGEETATFTLANPSEGLALGETATQSVIIADNDQTTVGLSVEPTVGNEIDESIFTITATASEAVSGEQTVDLIVGGEATGDDFAEDFPVTITLADGETTGSAQVTIENDERVEGNETAIFTLDNPSDGLALGETVEVPVTIADTDLAFPQPTTIPNLFDEEFYLNSNPDVAEAVDDGLFDSGLEHFFEFGLAEERDPSAILSFFTEESYLDSNPDVDDAVSAGNFVNGLEHFLIFGVNEGRPGAGYDFFNAEEYLSVNPDVATAVEIGQLDTALEHFLRFGFEENRSGVDLPDEQLDSVVV